MAAFIIGVLRCHRGRERCCIVQRSVAVSASSNFEPRRMLNCIDPTAIDRLLSVLEIRAAPFTICDVRSGWRLEFGSLDSTHAHIVLQGTCEFYCDRATFAGKPQTFLLVPAGQPYSVETRSPVRRVFKATLPEPRPDGIIPVLRVGDGPPGVLTACGTVRALYSGTLDLLAAVPRAFAQSIAGADLLAAQLARLEPELAQPRAGTRAMIEAVLKQCLILLFRDPAPAELIPLPWSPGAAHQSLWRAFMMMAENFHMSHSVDDLADVAGMSRSAFADRFVKAFGRSPMLLLREMRLRRAAELLKSTAMPIEMVARKVGYESRSQFSRAFRELHGITPKGFRAGSTVNHLLSIKAMRSGPRSSTE